MKAEQCGPNWLFLAKHSHFPQCGTCQFIQLLIVIANYLSDQKFSVEKKLTPVKALYGPHYGWKALQ